MKMKLKLNEKFLDALEKDVETALIRTGEVLQDVIRQEHIIPRDLGALQNEKFFLDTSEVDKGVVSLGHEGPYAIRLYYHPEYNFQRESWIDKNGVQHGGNENAQGLWFTPWEKGGKYENVPQELFDKNLEAILKGKE